MVIGRRQFKVQQARLPGPAILRCDWSDDFETQPTARCEAFHLAGAAAFVASLVKRSKKMFSAPAEHDFP